MTSNSLTIQGFKSQGDIRSFIEWYEREGVHSYSVYLASHKLNGSKELESFHISPYTSRIILK